MYPINSSPREQNIALATGITSVPQGPPGGASRALHAACMSAPQRLAPTTFAHFPSNAQRTSDSSSGCDSPLPLRGLNPSTLVPPGDEHTDALLQSLMSMPNKPMAQQQGPSGGLSGSSGLASGPSGLRPATLVGGQPALEFLLAQSHGVVPLGPAGDDARGQGLASFFYADDNVAPPRSLPPYASSVATDPVTMPYGSTMMLARHTATTASATLTTEGIKSAPNPSTAMRFHLEQQAAMLLPPTALTRLAMRPDVPLGPLQNDPSLTASPTATNAEVVFCHQETMFGGRQHAQLPPEALEAPRIQPAAATATHIQQQQQDYDRQQQRLIHEACATIAAGAPAATAMYREQQPGRLPPPAPQQQQQQQRPIAVGGMPMADARADQPMVRTIATDVIGSRFSCDEAAAVAEDWDGGGGTGSARRRRRIDMGQAALRAATSEKVVSIVGQIVIKKDALSGEAGAGSAPAGSIGRLSSGDVNTQTAPDKGEPGPLCFRSSSEVDDGQGGRDCRDGNEEDYTTDDGSDGNLNRSSRKRTASQRRRGSSAMKKELSRERNRTAQRRFRERQRDLIRALQERVERQDALIQDLRNRLGVYEDKPPYSGEGTGGDEPGSTSKTKTTGC
ncbi:hypothetical protein Vretimale_1368 [Volvox reticuliferus]|uniref:BZIP domain-containing protein n=1 Tax=Volvox reticuliferus TaxID=1737510 RepID=A0A8J4D7J9_9CHLO|nr:hypothetical protein Vretifemale_10770 [Volvox reticuliferus]GIL95326.1 hypothetical protein Vretimale_1368 [Volvox reticuliferus]